MSPRYLGGKYRSRCHPRLRKCACPFLRQTERVKSNCARSVSSDSHGSNEVDHAVCLKVEFQMHTVLSNENDKFYTTMIYPCFSRLVCVSMGSPAWWRFGLSSSGSSLMSRWRDAPRAHEFQMLRRRCKQIYPHWFRGVKCVSGECYQPYRENSSWYIRSDCLVQQIFNQSPPEAYFQEFTGSCYSLWVTGNSLWHRYYTGHAVDWCQLYFQGKYIFYVLINIFLN